MISFLEVLEDTEDKLGRQLQTNEIKFLQWVYIRLMRESENVEEL